MYSEEILNKLRANKSKPLVSGVFLGEAGGRFWPEIDSNTDLIILAKSHQLEYWLSSYLLDNQWPKSIICIPQEDASLADSTLTMEQSFQNIRYLVRGPLLGIISNVRNGVYDKPSNMNKQGIIYKHNGVFYPYGYQPQKKRYGLLGRGHELW